MLSWKPDLDKVRLNWLKLSKNVLKANVKAIKLF